MIKSMTSKTFASYCSQSIIIKLGSANVVRLLISRGADVEARDSNWNSTALVWAMIGSTEKPDADPDADWLAVVQALLEAGASIDGVELSEDDDHPPPPAVAELLRRHGVPG